MTVPPLATAMAAADSDSDDQERPQKEPEFVYVDERRPPAPPGQMYWPAPPPVFFFPPEQPHDGDDRRTECTYFLLLKAVHFALVMCMVSVMLGQATQLPDEYRKDFMIVCPIIIGIVAFSWILLSVVFDKDPC